MDKFDGFGIILFKDEDGDWLAHLKELPHISAFSDTPEAALKALELAWEAVKESCQKHGDPVPRPEKIPVANLMRYYMAVIEKGESNCSAYCPDLPGCITTGKTLDDTVRNMTEAVQFHTEGLPEDRDPVPRPGNPQARIGEINTEAGDLFAFIPVPEPGNIAAEIPAARERHPEPVAV